MKVARIDGRGTDARYSLSSIPKAWLIGATASHRDVFMTQLGVGLNSRVDLSGR